MSEHDENSAGSPETQTPRAINIPTIVLVFAALCVGVQILQQFLLSPEQNIELLVNGAFIPARYAYVQEATSWPAFTSPFSYSLLHGGFGHLVNNMLWLAVFGSPFAASTGWLRFTLFWFVCAACGALFHYLALPLDSTPMIGASGAIAGMMGAAARFGFRMEKSKDGGNRFRFPIPALLTVIRAPSVLAFLGVYIATNLAIGSGIGSDGLSNIAWQAHLGGIAAGFLLVPLFIHPNGVSHSSKNRNSA